MDTLKKDEFLQEYVKKLTQRGLHLSEAEPIAQKMYEIFLILSGPNHHEGKAWIGLSVVADVFQWPLESLEIHTKKR